MRTAQKLTLSLVLGVVIYPWAVAAQGGGSNHAERVRFSFPSKLRVTLLSFHSNTSGVSEQGWGAALIGFVAARLKEIEGVELRPGLGIDNYLLWAAQPPPPTEDALRELGQQLGSELVLSGCYERRLENYHVYCRLLDTRSTNGSLAFEVTSASWTEIGNGVVKVLLEHSGLSTTPAATRLHSMRWTQSRAAWEWFGKYFNYHLEGRPGNDARDALECAIQIDPSFAEARLFLTDLLMNKRLLDAAEQTALEGLATCPDSADFHRALGDIFLARADWASAEMQFDRAARLDSDNEHTFLMLGSLHMQRGSPAAAISDFGQAVGLNPISALSHAHLGYAYALTSQTNASLLELAKSARLGLTAERIDLQARKLLVLAYSAVGEQSLALAQYKELHTTSERGKALGWDAGALSRLDKVLSECRTRLQPRFFDLVPPRDLPPEAVEKAIQQRIPVAAKLNCTPLAGSEGITNWAREITRSGTNELQKALTLCAVLANGCPPTSPAWEFVRPGTAENVFDVWKRPRGQFRCQELAYLYVALARAVGLRAYFAWVDELWDESKDPHSCAIIFTSGGALLCDPANWVGVPHVKFRVLSDLEVAALHLSCGADLKTCEVACKLLPENVIPHANLFEHYRSQGRWDDAAAQAAQMESLDRDGVFTCYARSVLLMREGNTELAVDLLQKAISSAPRRDILYLELGNACRKQNRLAEAHKAYEFALRCPTGAETRSYVLALLAAVEAQICIEKNDLAGALACAERAARTSVDEEFSELVESVMRMIGDNTHPSSKYPK